MIPKTRSNVVCPYKFFVEDVSLKVEETKEGARAREKERQRKAILAVYNVSREQYDNQLTDPKLVSSAKDIGVHVSAILKMKGILPPVFPTFDDDSSDEEDLTGKRRKTKMSIQEGPRSPYKTKKKKQRRAIGPAHPICNKNFFTLGDGPEIEGTTVADREVFSCVLKHVSTCRNTDELFARDGMFHHVATCFNMTNF